MKIGPQHFLIVFFIFFSGCATHQISFQDIDYSIDAQKYDTKMTVAMDNKTLNNEVTIKSWMTGIGQDWNAQPGQMVKQVADIEFPQMFESYEFLEVFREPQKGTSDITMKIGVLKYEFANFQATFTLLAKVYGDDKRVLLDKSYTETGMSQGAKMFWGGAFAMKSAVRQSSFDALKKIFASLRRDLAKALLADKGS
jgi:hypothetical protein